MVVRDYCIYIWLTFLKFLNFTLPFLPNYHQPPQNWTDSGTTEAKSTKPSPWPPWSPCFNFNLQVEIDMNLCFCSENLCNDPGLLHSLTLTLCLSQMKKKKIPKVHQFKAGSFKFQLFPGIERSLWPTRQNGELLGQSGAAPLTFSSSAAAAVTAAAVVASWRSRPWMIKSEASSGLSVMQ